MDRTDTDTSTAAPRGESRPASEATTPADVADDPGGRDVGLRAVQTALLQEIDTAKAALRRFEEEALAALEETENAELAEAGKKEAFAGLAARYQEGLARWEEEKPALRAVLATTRETIATLRASLTPALRSQFERIYERTKGEALAPLRRTERVGGPSLWHCGHCNYQVRPQVAVEIRSARALVQCESCKRLLYPEPAS